ncbi:MAG: radical SAM protein [Actinomycetota bacterium]|nr:radical SAM protein [Actinomycetota bacterium]
MARQNLEGIVIRPPSEAGSFLLQVTHGCSHNRCSFCITYKFTKFGRRPFEKIKEDIELASRHNPHVRRVFLCDGNAMCLSTEELSQILDLLNKKFKKLERVGIYANATDILSKSLSELKLLREKKLGIGYLGLESGNDEILKKINKGSTSKEMTQAVRKAQEAGMLMSVIVLLGLGSNSMSKKHAEDSAVVISRMNPSFLSALTLMLLPGTPLYSEYLKGNFGLMNPLSILEELECFVSGIEVEGPCVFRTNHASNYLPLGGVLPDDKAAILEAIEYGISNPSILRSEKHRAL